MGASSMRKSASAHCQRLKACTAAPVTKPRAWASAARRGSAKGSCPSNRREPPLQRAASGPPAGDPGAGDPGAMRQIANAAGHRP